MKREERGEREDGELQRKREERVEERRWREVIMVGTQAEQGWSLIKMFSN